MSIRCGSGAAAAAGVVGLPFNFPLLSFPRREVSSKLEVLFLGVRGEVYPRSVEMDEREHRGAPIRPPAKDIASCWELTADIL